MSFELPENLRYTESHEWVAETDDSVRFGITDFAQDELGDIVFLELPDEGDSLEAGTACVTIESIKAISDVYSPVDGVVVETNDRLLDEPEVINEDPYGDGWLVELQAEVGDELLDPQEYSEQIE
jgi:glycine cleavage system H protein